ncbi:MAG TPA: hypothetical protein VHJ77_04985 [Vicinamibacterales bacterium]|nr:hypothetical protein [Vicinamibacterales bacterium]
MTAILLVGLAAAIGGTALILSLQIRRSRDDFTAAALLTLFAPAPLEVREDPRRLLDWQPTVDVARRLFGPAMERLDAAAGRPYPFGPAEAREAHARWTSAWLAWERAHDEEYKLKASAAEAAGGTGVRAAVGAIERDKLERYQRRYEEYVRIGKALAALGGER